MFQESLEFSGRLADNVMPLDPDDLPRVSAALRAANADGLVDSLPDGLSTRLASWFPGGTELSGGEWQRIAMARAFATQSPILVFDEPTSAMDPWAERVWLAGLRRHAAGRTIVLITHRLTTAEKADIVHIMQAGQIIESGNHQELLAMRGTYAHLWGVTHAPPNGSG